MRGSWRSARCSACASSDATHQTLTIEATGSPDKLEALLELLGDFGIVELARTGRIALTRGDRGHPRAFAATAKAAGGRGRRGTAAGCDRLELV